MSHVRLCSVEIYCQAEKITIFDFGNFAIILYLTGRGFNIIEVFTEADYERKFFREWHKFINEFSVLMYKRLPLNIGKKILQVCKLQARKNPYCRELWQLLMTYFPEYIAQHNVIL